jgi:hypothetical protein
MVKSWASKWAILGANELAQHFSAIRGRESKTTAKQQHSYPLTQSTALYKDKMEKMRDGRSSRRDEAEKDE